MSSLMHEETMVSLQVYAPPLLLLLTFIITFYYFTRPSTELNLPPSPPKLPVIGNIHQLGPILHRSLRDLSTRYGGPLMLMRMGSVPTLVISSADAAREIMKTQDLIFATRPDVRRWRQILYDQKEVSVAPYGEEWRQFKSIMVLHFLSKNKVEAYREVREEETAIAVRKIKKSCDLKESVNLTDLFMKLTNDVVCRVTFGTKYSEGESGKKFKNMLKEYFDVLSELDFEDMIPWLWWVDRLRGTAARVEKVAKDVDEFLDGLVEERRRKPLTGGDGDHGKEDFLEILIKIQKEGGNSLLDRDAIKGLLLDVYTAGTDTTTTVLEWIFAELLKHPRTFKKLQQEVRAIFKDKKQINQQDIDNMKYLKAVIKETLRLHPPAPTLIPRVSREDAKVMGYDIMKGTRVIINGWAIQRDPKVWDEPDEFKPERFLDNNNTIDYKGQDFGLIPFGAGRRGCPGMSFALAIDEHVLATLLHKFDWELPNGQSEADLDMEEEPGITVHKKVPLFAMAKPFSS